MYFAASANGWTCNELGLQWLERIFIPYTQEKAGLRNRRLLIVDGYSSYVNMAFINYADSHRVIVAVLLSYSTHRLQLLNIGLFSLLSTAYSRYLNAELFKGFGITSMTKRQFYPIFRNVYYDAFT